MPVAGLDRLVVAGRRGEIEAAAAENWRMETEQVDLLEGKNVGGWGKHGSREVVRYKK